MTETDWHQTDSRVVVQNKWLTFYENDYRLADGCRIYSYFILERPNFVLVLASSRSNEIALVRQYRPATAKSYWSLPAGYLRENEIPLEAARRELMEETGLKASDLREVTCFDPLPGYIRSKAHVVECNFDGEPTMPSNAEAGLREVCLVNITEAHQMVLKGEIKEMQAACAILFFYAKRQAVGS